MAVWVITKPVPGHHRCWWCGLKMLLNSFDMTELNPSWMTWKSRGSEKDTWHNQMTYHQQNALILFSKVMNRTPPPPPAWTALPHFLCTCASARHCQHSSQMIQTSFIIWSDQSNYPRKFNTLCTDMRKDLVMVAMDAAEASSPALEKEILMELWIIFLHCLAQVSNKGRDRKKEKQQHGPQQPASTGRSQLINVDEEDN